MKNGISLQAVDDMDILRYFDVLIQEIRTNRDHQQEETAIHDPNAVILERGTIDSVFG